MNGDDHRRKLRALRLVDSGGICQAQLVQVVGDVGNLAIVEADDDLCFLGVFTAVLAPTGTAPDALDAGSVASPNRETESMADGSDAVADWPLLNALVNTAAGASWVSIHHGGGVGIGRSIHAGMVVVADGSELSAQKLERVLTNDPGSGVMRHADAGYEIALRTARETGLDLPMLR